MRFELRPGVRRLFRLPLWTDAARRRDVDDELQALIANRVDYLVARGMSPAEARAEAEFRLGASIDDARLQLQRSLNQRERRMRVSERLDSVLQDIRYAARGLLRRPAFTVVAVLTLAIGVGATTAIFSAVNVLLLRPLPYQRAAELMRVQLFIPAQGDLAKNESGWSYPMFTMFRDGQRSFESLAAYTFGQVSLTSGEVERLSAEYVGAAYLRVLGLSPTLGRDFDRALDANGAASHAAIISYALWQRRFDGDASIVGRTVDIDRQPWTIIGVGPRDFRGLTGQADVLLPATSQPAIRLSAKFYNFYIIARRARGVTEAQAAAAATALGARVAEAYPNPMGKLNWQMAATPLDDARLDPAIERSLLVLFGAVGLVLLIACVNVANLLLGRASVRQSEMAIRVAIGAGRGRLIRLLLTESLLLAVVGGAASIAVAWIGARALSTVNPSAIARGAAAGAFGALRFSAIELDSRALAFTLLASLLVGVSFGVVPALGTGRGTLTGALKSDRRSSGVGVGRRLLVVGEVALALVLLIGSGLMIRSLAKLLTIDAGFDATSVLTFRATPPAGSVARDSMPGFYSEILDRIRALPGVRDAALASCAPLSGGPCGDAFFRRGGEQLVGPADMHRLIDVTIVSPNWFSAMRVRLDRGRMFAPADRLGTPQVLLLNEAAARKFFGAVDPIGQRVSLGGWGGITDAEVIGIVAGVRQRPDSASAPEAYIAIAQSPSSGMMFFVRTSSDAAAMARAVRRAVHDVAPQVPVYDMMTMTERTAATTADSRFRAVLLTAFAITALLLAAIGIYGVMSFAVTARTREIGIRIALGAEGSRVQRLVIGEGLGLVCAGATIGVVGALAATRVLRTFLFDLAPTDPLTYASVVVLLGLTAFVASWLPARRAARVDPLEALRAE